MTDILVIAGPAGVGKSSVAFEVSLQLQAAGIDHALIDTDALDHIRPVPDDLPAITERNLAAVWQTFAERRAHRLILVGVYLIRPEELAWIGRAVPDAAFTLVRLRASEATLRERIRERETGSGAQAQLGRTLGQVTELDRSRDPLIHLLDTDAGSVGNLAARIVALWTGSRPTRAGE